MGVRILARAAEFSVVVEEEEFMLEEERGAGSCDVDGEAVNGRVRLGRVSRGGR
jgi:hypothetical protein